MLNIKALKLEINTTAGLFGTIIELKQGLNIVRGDNTTGKSTLFQSILYALGFEELLGGKNEKTMQSVLKDEVADVDGKRHKVLQSFVLLEIENTNVVTIRRGVVSEKRKSILIDVIDGPFITNPAGNYKSRQMYVHDQGAASDETFGFHAFLEEFLGWDLPEVMTTYGDFVKLYLPLIAPSFIIEQKSGWSSFFATQPYYNVRNSEARVVEFLLNLDVFQNERLKQSIQAEKRIIEEKWAFIHAEFRKLADRSSAEIIGLDSTPRIINNINEIYLRTWRDGKSLILPELIQQLLTEHKQLEDSLNSTTGIDIPKTQARLESLTTDLNRYNVQMDYLVSENFHEKEKLKQYILQRKSVEEDLKNNKAAMKMYSIGGDLPTSLATSNCPTCGQDIKDSLLPKEVDQQPMQIEENISFSEAQKRMLDVFIEGQRKKIAEGEIRLNAYREQITALRQRIRSLKKDLISDDRLPSEAEIEQKLNLKKQIEFFSSIIDATDEVKERVEALSRQWENALTKEKNLPKDFFSALDRQKLRSLEENLIDLLQKFHYKSKERESIKISYEKYLPVIETPIGNGKLKTYDIRFDSSGSDLIRCLWAYHVALLKTSNDFNGCHPQLLLMDEPQQQSASTKDFHGFLQELSIYVNSQVLVFASFQNSEEDFLEATDNISFNLIKGDAFFIKKLPDNPTTKIAETLT